MTPKCQVKSNARKEKQYKHPYFVEEEYLVTALVPSETACLASSPGRMRRTLRRWLAGAFFGLGDDIRGLDLARGDGGLLVVGSKLGSLRGDALEDIYVTS